MNDVHVIATVLVLYVAIVVSPGPNFALLSRLALRGDVTAARGATLGMAVAATIYAVLAMTGLAVLLQQVGWLTRTVQIGGGCYLAWLGVRAWRDAGRMTLETGRTGGGPPRGGLPDALRGFRTGMAVNLSNPKGIAFFVGLYAVAVPPETAAWAKASILALSFAIELAWYGAVIALLSTGRARGAYARLGVPIERALGALLVLFGVRLVAEKA